MRIIIGKAFIRIVKYDLQGTIQLCAGEDAGSEAAVDEMEQVFADEDTEAMILVNALLEQTRGATSCLCTALAHIFINTMCERIK